MDNTEIKIRETIIQIIHKQIDEHNITTGNETLESFNVGLLGLATIIHEVERELFCALEPPTSNDYIREINTKISINDLIEFFISRISA